MSTILLYTFSGLDFITGVISIIVQSVIIANHEDCAYSKMGVGIWNGLLLIITGISLLVMVTSKKKKTGDWELIICAMALITSLVQVGIACGVIYQLYSLQYFDHGPTSKKLTDILGIPNNTPSQKVSFDQAFDDIGTFGKTIFNRVLGGNEKDFFDTENFFMKIFDKVGGNMMKSLTVRVCYGILSPEDYGSQRKTLEVILLGCGLIAIVVKLASFLSLGVKRLVVSATIQYTQQTAATH